MDLHMAVPWETVSLTAVGDKRRLFYEMLEEAKHLALEKTAGMTIMYTAMGSEWRVFGNPRKPRPLHSVVLDTGLTDAICCDVEEFLNCSQWYVDRGIPYRRGYLLHGPPGCGKSSFITALAGHLQLSVCVLNLSERGLTDDRLNHLLAVAPENSIILLEDIDSAFVSRQDNKKVRTAYEGLTPVTFSGLLNCLDGVASTEARIVFMTTNYRERLDPALIRPGRVDMIQYIGHCSSQQLEELYTRFYPEQPHGAALAFAQAMSNLGRPVSAAEVQGHFQQYKHDPHGALDGVPQLGADQGIRTPQQPPTIDAVTSAVGSVRGYSTLAANVGSVLRYYSMRAADAGSLERYNTALEADPMREHSALTAQGVERKECVKRISSLVRRLDTNG